VFENGLSLGVIHLRNSEGRAICTVYFCAVGRDGEQTEMTSDNKHCKIPEKRVSRLAQPPERVAGKVSADR